MDSQDTAALDLLLDDLIKIPFVHRHQGVDVSKIAINNPKFKEGKLSSDRAKFAARIAYNAKAISFITNSRSRSGLIAYLTTEQWQRLDDDRQSVISEILSFYES